MHNLNEVNSWIDTTDEVLNRVGAALHRVLELLTQASNDTNSTDEHKKSSWNDGDSMIVAGSECDKAVVSKWRYRLLENNYRDGYTRIDSSGSTLSWV